MDNGFHPPSAPTFIQGNSELPAMIDAACDILLANAEDSPALSVLDAVVSEELVNEAASFLITVFRERRVWTENFQHAQQTMNRWVNGEVQDGR